MANKRCQWIVEGAGWTWEKPGYTSDNIEEVATHCLEDVKIYHKEVQERFTFDKGQNLENLQLGAILVVHNNLCVSEDDFHVVFTPRILANAGMLEDAKILLKEVEKDYPILKGQRIL